MRRSFGRRGDRPARFWQDISRNFTLAAVSTSTITSIFAFEAPAAGTLTSLPPEDITLLRIVGNFQVTMAGEAASWTLGLMVVDPGWTPSLVGAAGFQTDADKRILWHESYEQPAAVTGFVSSIWSPPGNVLVNGTVDLYAQCPREATHLDITPKVKLEAGKSLSLVAWENSGAATFSATSFDMRVLFQRSRRR